MPSPSSALRLCAHLILSAPLWAIAPSIAQPVNWTWGTFERPYAATSPWNSRPIDPVLGTAVIPARWYFPTVTAGAYSTQAFRAQTSDGSMEVHAYPGSAGISIPDTYGYVPTVTIPRWPANTQPATGTDGHAEIIDEQTGKIHSFFGLKQVEGLWQAKLYAWSPLQGRGWADPAYFHQGARSSGVSTIAGLIRAHEVNDGDTMYRHALAMSMDYTGLSRKPTYVFPATTADYQAEYTNSGSFPLGTLMMLPPSFNEQAILNPDLRKVALTLKTYGAYAVERNFGTPYVIFAEIGSPKIVHKTGWTNRDADDLQRIRAALRAVVSTSGWLDGNGQPYQRSTEGLNILSIGRNWMRTRGPDNASFDIMSRQLVFKADPVPTTMVMSGTSMLSKVTWAQPAAGQTFLFSANTTGGATIRISLIACTGYRNADSGTLSGTQVATLVWPEKLCSVRLMATGATNRESSVAPTLTAYGPP
jgi:hypothetical protein